MAVVGDDRAIRVEGRVAFRVRVEHEEVLGLVVARELGQAGVGDGRGAPPPVLFVCEVHVPVIRDVGETRHAFDVGDDEARLVEPTTSDTDDASFEGSPARLSRSSSRALDAAWNMGMKVSVAEPWWFSTKITWPGVFRNLGTPA